MATYIDSSHCLAFLLNTNTNQIGNQANWKCTCIPGAVYELPPQVCARGGGAEAPSPQILTPSYYVYKQLQQKNIQNVLLRKTREEKILSAYKQCYTYNNQSLEIRLLLRGTDTILEATPPTSQKLSTPLYTAKTKWLF